MRDLRELPRLARAFDSAAVRFEADASRTVKEMAACADFSRVAWIEDRKRAGWKRNGPAEVTTVRRGADLEISVTARARSWIVVSQTFWKGWQARRAVGKFPYFANQAFLSFEVEPEATGSRSSTGRGRSKSVWRCRRRDA
jgi:hypothetical protein